MFDTQVRSLFLISSALKRVGGARSRTSKGLAELKAPVHTPPQEQHELVVPDPDSGRSGSDTVGMAEGCRRLWLLLQSRSRYRPSEERQVVAVPDEGLPDQIDVPLAFFGALHAFRVGEHVSFQLRQFSSSVTIPRQYRSRSWSAMWLHSMTNEWGAARIPLRNSSPIWRFFA